MQPELLKCRGMRREHKQSVGGHGSRGDRNRRGQAGGDGAEGSITTRETLISRTWNTVQNSQVPTKLCCRQIAVKPINKECVSCTSSDWSTYRIIAYYCNQLVSASDRDLCCGGSKSYNPVDDLCLGQYGFT